jgi:hypothetical protein
MRRLLVTLAAATAGLVAATSGAVAQPGGGPEEPLEDLTPPVLTITPQAGGVDGWYADTATVHVRATDPGAISSGVRYVAWTMTGAQEGAGGVDRLQGGTLTVSAAGRTTISVEAADGNDNHTYGGTVVGIDRTAPSVALQGALGASERIFARGQQLRAEFSCGDGESGLASCAGTRGQGEWLDTSTTGFHTFAVTGRDRVGNARTVTQTYEVVSDELQVVGGVDLSGSEVVGGTLVGTSPVLTPTPTSIDYQWLRGGAPIAGATGRSYTLTPDDARTTVQLRATARRTGWQDRTLLSRPVQVAAATIALTSLPVLAGAAQVGEGLVVSHGAVTPTAASLSYQWLRDGVLVPEVSGRSYVVRPGDLGARISVRVTATAPGHAEGVWVTGATAPVRGRPLEVVGSLTVTGTPRAGSVLTARTPVVRVPLESRVPRAGRAGRAVEPGAPATLGLQWLRDGRPIAGATAATYRLGAGDVGRRVTVRLTASRPVAEGYEPVVRTSAATAPTSRAVPVVRARATARGKGRVVLALTVAAPGVDPTGAVVVRRGAKVVARGRVPRSGRLSLALSRQPRGTVTWTVSYAGSTVVSPRAVRVAARVR